MTPALESYIGSTQPSRFFIDYDYATHSRKAIDAKPGRLFIDYDYATRSRKAIDANRFSLPTTTKHRTPATQPTQMGWDKEFMLKAIAEHEPGRMTNAIIDDFTKASMALTTPSGTTQLAPNSATPSHIADASTLETGRMGLNNL